MTHVCCVSTSYHEKAGTLLLRIVDKKVNTSSHKPGLFMNAKNVDRKFIHILKISQTFCRTKELTGVIDWPSENDVQDLVDELKIDTDGSLGAVDTLDWWHATESVNIRLACSDILHDWCKLWAFSLETVNSWFDQVLVEVSCQLISQGKNSAAAQCCASWDDWVITKRQQKFIVHEFLPCYASSNHPNSEASEGRISINVSGCLWENVLLVEAVGVGADSTIGVTANTPCSNPRVQAENLTELNHGFGQRFGFDVGAGNQQDSENCEEFHL